MKYAFDPEYTLSCFRTLVNVPSPVGYYRQMNPVMERFAAELGCAFELDNKSTPYFVLEGEDNHVRLAGPADGELRQHQGDTEEDHHAEIDQQVDPAAALIGPAGKLPDIAEPYG